MNSTATLTQDNGETTLTLAYTVTSDTMLKYATAWAKHIFMRGENGSIADFDALTNQELADIILDQVLAKGKSRAKAQVRTDAIFDAQAQADIAEIEGM